MNTPVPSNTNTTVSTPQEVPTMTSREMVEYINSERKKGEAELRHSDFLAKVPKVLGVKTSEKFRTSLKDSYGRNQPGYRFPKREACLMAMSYSYELQSKVYDRMSELEQQIANPQPAIPQTLPEALRFAADAVEEKEKETQKKIKAEQERDEAVCTKAEIGARREATALARASAEKRRADKLAIQLEKSEQWFTIKRVEIMQGKKFNWRELKRTSLEMGYSIKKAFDANYGHVKAYHKDIWRQVYQVKL